MKFYIASRTSKINKVKEYIKLLKQKGHTVSYDWTEIEDADLARPYLGHEDKVRNFAEMEIQGVKDADVFVIISDAEGTGMYVEMGIALTSNTRIYSVGEHNDATVFHFHPSIIKKANFEDVLDDLNSKRILPET